MTKNQAAAWAIAGEFGFSEAIDALDEVKAEINSNQWSGPGSR